MRGFNPVYLYMLPAIVFIVLFWLIPISQIFYMSLTSRDSFITGEPAFIGLSNYGEVFSTYLPTIRNTVVYPLTAALIDLVIGYPLGYYLARRRVPLASLLRASLIFPYFGDIYVSYGLWNMFLPGGLFDPIYQLTGISYRDLLYTPFSVILGFSIFTLPFMVLYISSAVSQIDPSLEDAAITLGANPVRMFFKVVLPLSAPGAIAGFIACFGWNLGGFLIPLLLGGVESSNLITVRIVTLSLQQYNYGLAAALASILILITLVSTYMTLRITRTLA